MTTLGEEPGFPDSGLCFQLTLHLSSSSSHLCPPHRFAPNKSHSPTYRVCTVSQHQIRHRFLVKLVLSNTNPTAAFIIYKGPLPLRGACLKDVILLIRKKEKGLRDLGEKPQTSVGPPRQAPHPKRRLKLNRLSKE